MPGDATTDPHAHDDGAGTLSKYALSIEQVVRVQQLARRARARRVVKQMRAVNAAAGRIAGHPTTSPLPPPRRSDEPVGAPSANRGEPAAGSLMCEVAATVIQRAFRAHRGASLTALWREGEEGGAAAATTDLRPGTVLYCFRRRPLGAALTAVFGLAVALLLERAADEARRRAEKRQLGSTLRAPRLQWQEQPGDGGGNGSAPLAFFGLSALHSAARRQRREDPFRHPLLRPCAWPSQAELVAIANGLPPLQRLTSKARLRAVGRIPTDCSSNDALRHLELPPSIGAGPPALPVLVPRRSAMTLREYDLGALAALQHRSFPHGVLQHPSVEKHEVGPTVADGSVEAVVARTRAEFAALQDRTIRRRELCRALAINRDATTGRCRVSTDTTLFGPPSLDRALLLRREDSDASTPAAPAALHRFVTRFAGSDAPRTSPPRPLEDDETRTTTWAPPSPSPSAPRANAVPRQQRQSKKVGGGSQRTGCRDSDRAAVLSAALASFTSDAARAHGARGFWRRDGDGASVRPMLRRAPLRPLR